MTVLEEKKTPNVLHFSKLVQNVNKQNLLAFISMLAFHELGH